MKSLIALLALHAASALVLPAKMARVTPLLRAPRGVLPAKMSIVSDLKSALVPNFNPEHALRNFYGLQGIACGLAGLIVPAQIMTTVFGGALITAPTVLLFRGLALNHLVLGSRICESESDTQASVPACLWFGSWTYVLRRAVMAGTIGAYSNFVAAWTATCALVAAFGQGGATATLQKFAEGGGPLPRKEKLKGKLFTPTTLVGVHLLLSGFACLAFQPILLGPSFLTVATPGVPAGVAKGVAVAVGEYAKHALTLTGVGLTNILLGSTTLGGSDRAAAANGVVLLGGWAGGLYYARAAGLFTGQYVGLVALWHALVAASCALTLLDEDTPAK